MKLAELFPEGGRGVIATADASGQVNTAVYAIPHVIDEETVAWGMTPGRTYDNLLANPNASYLYLAPSRGGTGWRLTLQLKDFQDSGQMLDEIREHTSRIVSTQAGEAVRYVARFKVTEIRPLV
ncbi:pyridoxamine 5'-phosphate oxidase family protein [Geotalea toluenoxydans]|uniref:pyridoxamine 5'-phosphate oxidase family protein n=1 Tax=Geotalea toluenoxydans TaxID=421624 RepID=UPI0006CF36ED|nr:pyridoxamine 5'-phosphate oxidase family protein [Geotalea toluenoxydans]